MITAQEFTTQLERLNRELNKFWEKEDKVASLELPFSVPSFSMMLLLQLSIHKSSFCSRISWIPLVYWCMEE